MGSNRLPYFPFHADDYLNDPAVILMSPDTEGCYIRMLARSWQTGTPGVVHDALVYDFAAMHRVCDEYRVLFRHFGDSNSLSGEFLDAMEHYGPEDIARERVEEIYGEMKPAFDLVSKPGFWVQKRMVSEFEKLSRSLRARQAGAAKTNEIMVNNGDRNGDRPGHRAVTARLPAEEVEVEREVEESKSTHSSPNGSGRRSVRTKRSKSDHPIDREWLETFDEVWWPEYHALGRKCSRAAAREVWAKIPHREGQSDFDRLTVAFDSSKAEWKGYTGPQYIPHAETWLRDYLKNLLLEAQ